MAKWFPVWFQQQFFLKNGEVNANGYVEALVHGTTNHAPVYNYNDVEISNPIALNQYGRCQIKLSDLIAYDFVVYDKNMGIDNTIENVRIPTTSGETGTNDHSQLINRDMVNQHPQSAIINLTNDLDDKVSKSKTTLQSLSGDLDITKSGQNGSVSISNNFGTATVSVNNTNGNYSYSQANSFASIQKVGCGTSSVETSSTATRARSEYDTNTKGVLIEVDEIGEYAKIEINSGEHRTEYNEKGINFDINPLTTHSLTEGQSQWNATDHTLEIGMGSGVVQQIGQELPFPAKNVSGESFIDGQIGYVFGASGQRIAMKKPSASSDTALKALFMATQTVADNNTGFFNAIGLVRGLNTLAFTEGTEVWLDTVAGVITATPPAKPNYQARMGYVVNVHGTNGSVFFHPDIFPKIGDLSDCNTSATVQGDFLTKGSDGVFKPNVFWDDWRWAAYARVAGGNAPSYSNINATGIYSWEFTNGKELYYNDMQIPHEYKEGTDIVPHIHFCPSTTATYTGTWTFEYIDWLSTLSGSALQVKKTITAAFNASMTAFQMQSVDFVNVISGTNRKISSVMHGKLSLALTAGTSLFMCGFDGHYQKDRFGSNSETSK